MEIIIIVAMAANRVIGRGKKIPWHLPGEQQRFKEITWGFPLIMGRKTFESIGHPLPGRRNIVITRNGSWQSPGCDVVGSMEKALQCAPHSKKFFVIGGAQIYQLALPFATGMILTTFADEVDGDVFFPEFSQDDFVIRHSETVDGSVPYVMTTWQRKE
jgi:dihydrofolate reductase